MNLYDVLAGQGTTHFERLFSQKFAGGEKTQTMTGTPPLTFKANGKPLILWSMLGNGQQSGTPSPQNIVPFDGTGERTGNLFDKSKQGGQVYVTESVTRFGVEIPVVAGTYTISGGTGTLFVKEKIGDTYGTALNTSYARTYTLSQDGYILIYAARESSYEVDNLMLVSGSTAPTSYIPYGYSIPLTCASQTTPLYLGEVSTTRRIRKLVLTGEENITPYDYLGRHGIAVNNILERNYNRAKGICTHYPVFNGDMAANVLWIGVANRVLYFIAILDTLGYTTVDEFKSFLAAQYASGTPVTVWYVLAEPETTTVNEPLAKIGDYADELHSEDAGVTIPTAKGANTLTVETDLQPSSMTITFK